MTPSPITLSPEETEFYSRQIVLNDLGYAGQIALKKAKVCICGLGGLGSPIAIQLAAMGIGYLRIIDRDIVDPSNLQRQHLYTHQTIGAPKVEAAMNHLKAINPYITVDPIPWTINEYSANDLVKGVDLILDGLDQMSPRYAINQASVQQNIPYIFGGAVETYGNVSTLIPGKTPCLRCIYPDLDDSNLPTCATVGVHPSILSLTASIQVAEAIRLLTGKPPLLTNQLLFIDLQHYEFTPIQLAKSPTCSTCNSIQSPPTTPQIQVETLCGRQGHTVNVITPPTIQQLNLSAIRTKLDEASYITKYQSQYGITLETPDHERLSILSSGIVITEHHKTKDLALQFYNDAIIPYIRNS